MSIKEGFEAVHKAMFGFSVGQYKSLGHCTRCKKELRFSPVDGNCQPDCHFEFGSPDGEKSRSIFNGAWVKFHWKADLCDSCLQSLSDWLLGDDWRYKECGQEKPK